MQNTTTTEVKPLREFPKNHAPENLLEKEKIIGRTGRILQVFLNADMRNGHDGLEKLAKDNNIRVNDLEPGQFVVFINSHKDRVRVYAASHVIAYVKLAQGRRVDLNVIREIPRVFLSSGRLDYDAALKEAVEQTLARKQKRVTEVVKP